MCGVRVVFVEPSFPRNQREFVRALASVGAEVIGIGESPQEFLDDELRGWMRHYHQVPNVTDVGAMTECRALDPGSRLGGPPGVHDRGAHPGDRAGA